MIDIYASLNHLDRLAALLQAEGMVCGPDVWLSVYRLLSRLREQGKLPQGAEQLKLLLGPLFCRNPEEQARFKVLFDQWWITQADVQASDNLATLPRDTFTLSAANRITSPVQTRLTRLQAKLTKISRAWIAGLLSLVGIIVAILMIWLQHSEPITLPPIHKVPPSTVLPAKPTEPAPTIAIIDHIPPRPQPEPQHLPSDWETILQVIQGVVLALPLLIALAGIARRYQQQVTVNREAAAGDDLFSQLRFERLLTPIFGGHQVEQELRDLRAAKIETSHRLNIKATVEATARRGDFFQPVYRQRRIAPEHVLLVRSMHRHDQQAAMAEELEKRFRSLGLHIETYRFRDDPRWLVRWSDKDDDQARYFRLEQILARFGSARLFVISETEIIYHPYSGEPRTWLHAFSPWSDKVWLHPQDANAAHARLLAQHQFMMLPLMRDSIPQLVTFLTTQPQPSKLDPQPAIPIQLPAMIGREPHAWLNESPPFGTDLKELIRQLEYFLGTLGLRLLRAVAVYPKPSWSLTQALDYLLYGSLNSAQGTADPPARREQRLAKLSRLPWLTHAYMPDWLREQLLLNLTAAEQQPITQVWQQLIGQLTQTQTVNSLQLEIRTPSKRQLRFRLSQLQATKNSEALHDPIFANIVLGGRFGLLDFKLPRAWAKLFPQASHSVLLRPALIVLSFATITSFGLYQAWHSYGATTLAQFRQQLITQDNRAWPVHIRHIQTTQPLALTLSEALQHKQFTVKLDDSAAADSTTGDKQASSNRIRYAPGGQAIADQIAVSLRWLTYGESIEPEEDSTLAASTIQVTLNRSYQTLAAFNDELHVPYVASVGEKPATTTGLPFEEPQMVRIPSGTFIMGSPESETGRASNEGPQRKVTITYSFEIGRHEVTFAQYDAFAKDTQRPLPDDRGWGRGNQPVINVSFVDAQAYVQWLVKKTGKKYRLPTEAEWEYVARAGTTTAYWWGDVIGQNNAVCSGCGSQWDDQQTAPVGSFKPNAFGVYDTAGNVWEWTQDCWHDDYANAPPDGTAWLEQNGGDCSRRVVRGGSWLLNPRILRSANRIRFTDESIYDTGFRVARDLP